MSAGQSSHATAVATDDFFIYTMGVVVPENLTRVRIDPSVERILESAFQDRTDLLEVELHDGLRLIGLAAFRNCTSLLRIEIPSSVTDIGHYAFERCTSLKEVNLTEGLQTIGVGTFQDCSSLHRIKIPSSVTAIGVRAFQDRIDLLELLNKRGAFKRCTSLQQIKIPSSVTVIGNNAFASCTSLKEVNLTEGLRSIGERAFEDCTSLHRIKIPSSVTAIDDYAFYSCTSLKEVNLAEGLQTIGRMAFWECTFLLRINIPSTVNSINFNAFRQCTLLRNVVIAPSSALTQDMFQQKFSLLHRKGFSLDMIIGRFDGLPLHRHCYYYRPQHHIEQTTDSTTLIWFNEEVGRLPAHGLWQDCFGMTPLHVVLSSSEGYDVRVCQCVIEKYPDAMLIEDKWGQVPLVYALFGEAPIEVIHFLLESHMQRWQAMPFDFGGMIRRLVTKGASADYVRDVIRAQRTHHRSLEIDWLHIVDDLIRPFRDIRMFSVLVEASVSKRSICMSEEHRIEVDSRLHVIGVEERNLCRGPFDRERYIEDREEINRDSIRESRVQYREEIRDMVTSYVRLHHAQLKESMTILELALWKTMICSKVDDQESRNECRTSGGQCLEVVIKHVLAFL